MNHPDTGLFEIVSERIDGSLPKYGPAVLAYFEQRSTETATIDDLGAFVTDRDPASPDESRVRIRLHHSVLPKLADSGLLDYDARSNVVRCRDLAAEKSDDSSVDSTGSEA